MSKLPFTKMVASGNDFIVLEAGRIPRGVSPGALARRVCDRKCGAGADGMLLLGKARSAAVGMRIFNADGSEADMCGNGARCAALYGASGGTGRLPRELDIHTRAGFIRAMVRSGSIRVRLTDPRHERIENIKVAGRTIRVHCVDTGVPHAVIFVEGLAGIDVRGLGRAVRYHPAFGRQGTNVNFCEVRSASSIAVRTYERGVEDETLACGTGSAASALEFARASGCVSPVRVATQSGEVLTVYFSRDNASLSDVWLEGKARIVYEGTYDV